jgi:Ca-activated chloride channel family protein
MRKISLLVLIFSMLVGSMAQGQTAKTRILFLLDASGSMYARMDNDTRIGIAKRLLTQMVDSLEDVENVEIALRVYGHTTIKTKRNCKDTRLEVPFSSKNHQNVKDKIRSIKPMGTTLIAYSLQEAAYDFPESRTARNIVVLITDGIEECDGDPCAVSEALQKNGVMLKPFIIGIGLDEDFQAQFECVGRYFEANTESDFSEVLNVVISQALNNTTAQVSLLSAYDQPTETNVNMTFYDAKTGRIRYNYIHTLNGRGNPDTLYIDPAYRYDLTVHTIPKVHAKNITLTSGMHNVIALDAGRGSLRLEVEGVTNYDNLQALIRDPKTGVIHHVQKFNTTEKYLNGAYTIEILSLPRIILNDVNVNQNRTTTLKIPQPGKLSYINREQLVGGIYRKVDGKIEWVTNINGNVGQHVLVLQPGQYTIITRDKSENQTIKTNEIDFRINSGEVKQIYFR